MKNIKSTLQKVTSALTLTACFIISGAALADIKVSESLPSTDVSNVSIDNQSGKINIVGWDKAEISVKGTLGDDAKNLVFSKKGAQVLIKVDYSSGNHWNTDGSNLTVHMPKKLRMKSMGVSTDINLDNLHGGVEVRTVSGDIEAKELSQSIELNTVSGNIESTNLSGKVSLAAVSGDIIDKNSQGRLEIRAVSGEVDTSTKAKEVFFNNVSGDSELNLAEITELRIRTVSGNLSVNLALDHKGLLKASTVSGDLDFIFQDDVDADFNIKSSVGGDIKNKLTSAKAEYPEYGPGAKLNFQTGNGSALVRVATVSGNVSVKSK